MTEPTLEAGDRLPDLNLPDETGERRTLTDLSGERGLVLYVYPKDDTPGCTIEAQDFRDVLPELRETGFEVAGLSQDGAESHCRFIDKYDLTFPLLTDSDGSFLEAIGAWGEKTLYGRKSEGVIRSTVVVSPEGEVLRLFRNVRAKGHAGRVVAELRTL